MTGNRLSGSGQGGSDWSQENRLAGSRSPQQSSPQQASQDRAPALKVTATDSSQTQNSATSQPAYSGTRHVMEWILFLALAVIMFRTFIAEGYMISTGSMAPTLLGFHRRIVCPSCQLTFVIGDSLRSDEEESGEYSDRTSPGQHVICPNCRRADIDFFQVPRNEGDQLLVHKNAYDWYAPKRWDVIVFRNPNNARQAYVKRLVGLPGETIDILNGDVYINGNIQRKPLHKQRAMRIPVSDNNYSPDLEQNPDWLQHWKLSSGDTPWSREGHAFVFDHQKTDPTAKPALNGSDIGWVLFRYGRQSGSKGVYKAKLSKWPEGMLQPEQYQIDLEFNPEKKELSIQGVMRHAVADKLIQASDDKQFFTAIRRLYQKSHRIPVDDFYGYNHPFYGTQSSQPIRDLMLSFDLIVRTPQQRGAMYLSMTNGDHQYTVQFDFSKKMISLYRDRESVPIRTGDLPKLIPGAKSLVEASLFDQQMLLAIDGVPCFKPWEITANETLSDWKIKKKPLQKEEATLEGTASKESHAFRSSSLLSEKTLALLRQPIRIGARNSHMKILNLKVYRDVYYRTEDLPDKRKHQQLNEEELFVLGDNSPISVDSRAWTEGTINRSLLIGKPFLLHLPSRPGQISVGGRSWKIRIPDFSRIHWIR